MTTWTAWPQTNAMGALWTPALGLLLDFAVKGLVLMALAWLAALAMRRASAAARHLVWALALGGLLALPVLSLVMPKWQLPILPRTIVSALPEKPGTGTMLPGAGPASDRATTANGRPNATALRGPKAMADAAANASRGSDALTGASFPEEEDDLLSGAVPDGASARGEVSALLAQQRLAGWVLAGWLAGALAMLAPLVAGLATVGRLVRRSQPFDGGGWDALSRSLAPASPVRVLCAGPGAMPMAVGLFRAAILLPAEAADWPNEKRRAVLLHELAHVRRRDCLTHALGHVALALHWCNPLAWLALRRLRIERERACDDLVLLAGERPSAYAEHLLDVASTLRASALASVAGIAMAQTGQLEGRLQAVLDPKRKRRVLRRAAIVVGVLLVLAVTVPLAMLKFSEARVFAKMTPEQKAQFDEWYTKKLTLSPEALEVKPFAPETVEAVREFFRLWDENSEQVRAIIMDWNQSGAGKSPDLANPAFQDFLTRHAEDLKAQQPLLAAFRAVVQRPDYTVESWNAASGPEKAGSDREMAIYGGVDAFTIFQAAEICRFDALACLGEKRMPEAIAGADALLACAQMDPYASMYNKLAAFTFLKVGIQTFQAIAERVTDPAEKKAILANLQAHRDKIRFESEAPISLITLDQIGMTRQPRRLGVVADLQNRTGYEIQVEANWVRLECLRKFGALVLPADPKVRDQVEREIRSLELLRESGKPLTTKRTGLRGYFSSWADQITAATMYSVAQTNFEQVRQHVNDELKRYDELIASVRDEDLVKLSSPVTAPGPTLPEPVPPAAVVSGAATTATAIAVPIDAKRAIEMLTSGKPDEQAKAAWLLANASEKPTEVIAPLVAAFVGRRGQAEFEAGGEKRYSTVEQEASKALATFGEPAVEPLIGSLDDLDRKTSQGAEAARRVAGVLTAVGPPAVPRLLAALGKPMNRASVVAPEALGRMGTVVVTPLLQVLRKGLAEPGAPLVVGLGAEPAQPDRADGDVRAAAAEALGWAKSPDAVEPLIERLADPNNQTRINAMYALGKIGDQRAVQPLLAIVREGKMGSTGQAALALGMIGGAEAGSALVDLLKGANPETQFSILCTLTYMQNPLAMGNSKARDAFIAIANDPEAPLRNRTLAVGGLRLFQDAASMDALERMLRDASEKPELRKEAAKSLGLLGTPGVERLAVFARGSDAPLQALAAGGLKEALVSGGNPNARYSLHWELYMQALRSLVTDAASQADLDALAHGNEYPYSAAGKSPNPRIRAAAQPAQKIADEELRLNPVSAQPDNLPWGSGAGGLLCRIRVHQPDFMEIRDSGGEHLWNDSDPPVVRLDLRNDSSLEYRFLAASTASVEVEVDGVKYAGPAVATDAATTATIALVAGWQRNAIPVVLDRRYTHEKLPLSWMPGKHQVRVIATVQPAPPNAAGAPVRLTSNPIEIAIVSAAPGGQGQSGHYEKDGIHLEAGFVPDKTEKLLGEDVALTFFVKNVSEAPFSLSTGGDGRGVRPTRFKISAVDARGEKVTDPNAQERNMGGLMGMPQLAPGGSYTEPLALSKWCLFDKPGVYTVTCRTVLELTKEAGFPTDQSAYTYLPIATSFTLTLKAPSSSQAKRIVADALAAAAAKKEVSGNFPVPADAVRSPQYLPSLLKAARGGDRAAIQAIGGIQTPEVTNALIELAQGWLKQKQLDLALAALDPVRPRMPNPRYYQKDEKTGAENEWSVADRLRVEQTWRPSMVKPMLAMGRQLAKNTDQKSLGLASDIFEYIGTAADMPDMIAGYTHAIDATRTLPFETWQYFRPRGATYGYRFATARLLERGGKVPLKPATPGEAAVYLIALNRQGEKPFRPADWPQVALQWLKSDIPYMRELVLDYLPEPMPEEVLAMLPEMLGDSYVDLQISACRVARDHPCDTYKEPLLKILREGEDKYTIGAAAEAAAANGVTDDEIETLWNARAAKPADRSGEKTDLNWLKDARKFMKGGQPMRPN